MERYDIALTGQRIHLAVEGSCGGTTVGLHAAADIINNGQRVLWASVDMPDPARFSQLFHHLSLVESSRFHAMNFGGKFERAMDALLEATNSLPSVGLVVMDDWCADSGRIQQDMLNQIKRFIDGCPEHVTVLLISKGSVDASGATDEPIVARSKDAISALGFEIWRLWKTEGRMNRMIDRQGEKVEVNLEESGFHT